jgi:hypothetical protein
MKFRVDFSRNFSSPLITSKLNLLHCTTGTPGSGVERFNSELCVLKYWLLSIKYGYLWLQKFAHRLLTRNFESARKSPVSGPAMYENLRVGSILGPQICPNAEAMVKCEGARILAMESCDWGKICMPTVRISFKANVQPKWIDKDRSCQHTDLGTHHHRSENQKAISCQVLFFDEAKFSCSYKQRPV